MLFSQKPDKLHEGSEQDIYVNPERLLLVEINFDPPLKGAIMALWVLWLHFEARCGRFP